MALRPALDKISKLISRFLGGPSGSTSPSMPAQRYLSDSETSPEQWLGAAESYVASLSPEQVAWLYRKPYHVAAGNPAFFDEMYQVLNLLKAMDITPGGRVLEVGSGPGWVTEILMSLGFEVDGIEPAEDMIAVAQERIAATRQHHRLVAPPRVEFHCESLEECSLPSGVFDAVVFHEALHHVIDERAGLAQTFRVLREGGVVGVSEWAWNPGDTELEQALDEEMDQFGTMENPFTQRYLDELLARQGFVELRRYHAVNGLFPVEDGDRTLEEMTEAPAAVTNNLTARKPWKNGPTTRDHRSRTTAEIQVIQSAFEADTRTVHLRLRIENTGETTWLKGDGLGTVQIAFRSDGLGKSGLLEAEPRQALPRDVTAGRDIEVSASFVVPEGYQDRRWFVDLVNEQLFWFSTREGSLAAEVSL